jgi:phosphohistidine swiveling domain-containing protein
VGGKAANLGELLSAGLPVPPGFCVTTHAYERAEAQAPDQGPVLERLEVAGPEEVPALAAQARAAIQAAPVPADVREAIESAYQALGPEAPVAVRSSATAEDLPELSFAGQQDTYLNVVGGDAMVAAVRDCWASLWTDRAVVYRATNGIAHRGVKLAVVVQRLIPAAWAGVVFTANPVTGKRDQAVLDASPGLGEAVVAGLVNPDRFIVDRPTRRVRERLAGERERVVVWPAAGGGTIRATALADEHVLDEREVLAVVDLAERIEQHYGGAPQDVEWAIDEAGTPWILQARPITTLFPLPRPAPTDGQVHVYLSLNVAQGVLGPLTPMGLDVFRRLGAGIARTVFGVAVHPAQGPAYLTVAAERLYVDVSPVVRNAVGRKILLGGLSIGEPRTAGALAAVLEDPRFAVGRGSRVSLARGLVRVFRRHPIPARVVGAFFRPERVLRRARARVDHVVSLANAPVGGPFEALERAEALLGQVLPPLLPHLLPLVIAGVASLRLAERIAGPEHREDVLLLTRGLPHNPTTEMDLTLAALATRWADDATVGPLLRSASAAELADDWRAGRLPEAFRRDLDDFLRMWGVRGVAEIDIGMPRWQDDPTHVLGVLANVARIRDPARRPDQQFLAARRQAAEAARRVAAALPLPRRLLFRVAAARVRGLLGLRELPKFSVIRVLGAVRRLLLAVGRSLAEQGRLERAEDVYFLTFAELRQALDGADPRALVRERKAVYAREQRRRRVPRVVLSDGTALDSAGPDAGAGALVGAPASPGVYEGLVRVVMDPHGARLDEGEVLVAPSTDPGWTPLFLTAGALVMEMGGMMSHGAVVAREYGIPAVVGVPNATTRLATGMRVRVDGSAGTVTPLGG